MIPLSSSCAIECVRESGQRRFAEIAKVFVFLTQGQVRGDTELKADYERKSKPTRYLEQNKDEREEGANRVQEKVIGRISSGNPKRKREKGTYVGPKDPTRVSTEWSIRGVESRGCCRSDEGQGLNCSRFCAEMEKKQKDKDGKRSQDVVSSEYKAGGQNQGRDVSERRPVGSL